MSDKTHQPRSLLDTWVKDNNSLVDKWKQQERGGDSVRRDRIQPDFRCYSTDFQKLLTKVQGVPPLAAHAQVGLTVTYNACVFLAAQSRFSEAELLLTRATAKALQLKEDDPVSEPPVFWRAVLKSVGGGYLSSSVQPLLCLQWGIWLGTCKLTLIQEFQDERSALLEMLSNGAGDCRSERTGNISDTPLLVTDPRGLLQLLQICTLITQGAERLSEGQSSEALSDLQTASSLPAPRSLVASSHLLSGACLAQMSCPQMALQCYRKALETDSRCVCALYRSMLIYKQLGNTQAEIQALRLLHSTLMLPTEPVAAGTDLFSPSLLLCSQSLNSLLLVPSALSVLHTLAHKCVLHGRVSEGVEYYLDLLATLQSGDQHGVRSERPSLPRLPELYLEAGAALLMARRPADCMAVCDEVISLTLELLPDKLVLEDPEETPERGSRDVCAEVEEKMATLLWAGAAYLLLGHCHTHLKDWKQAVTEYTRCINLLVKVRFKKRDFQPQIVIADMAGKQAAGLCVLQRLKGLSLAGRGICFSQTDQLREALRDIQLSLHAIPDCVSAGLWCGEVLWRLDRRREAAACWEQTWSFDTQPSAESLSLYLQEPTSGPLLDSMDLRHRIKELGPTVSS
ncbi:Fanconi anemia group G protein [Brachionichthys hirsutus]|uniref:Fanconi anemia group G protein n=1 Tax=Brachionichthys hirsutus TaxID=412623 RepID=UPI003604A210